LVERIRPLCSPSTARELDLRQPSDLARATLIHSRNAVTWSDYFTYLKLSELRPADEFWLDRSSMAIDAAVARRGVILEGDILTEEEIKRADLIAPFDDPKATIESTSYYIVRPRGYRSSSYVTAFVTWLKEKLSSASTERPMSSS
jgi:LysR family transcriptional regulator, glycine cleavage system transcriptional activator